MIIKGVEDTMQTGRIAYPLDGFSVPTDHFVIRETTPETPFSLTGTRSRSSGTSLTGKPSCR